MAKKHPIIPMISNIILGTLLPFLMYLPETKDPTIAKNNGNNVNSYNLSSTSPFFHFYSIDAPSKIGN